MHICFILAVKPSLTSGAGLSTATTVPGDPDAPKTGSAEKNNEAEPHLTTPAPKVKRSNTGGSSGSAPKVSRGRSPTVHYSPENKTGDPGRKKRRTAVKAKAAPKCPTEPPKEESPAPREAKQAVQTALARKCTAEVPDEAQANAEKKTKRNNNKETHRESNAKKQAKDAGQQEEKGNAPKAKAPKNAEKTPSPKANAAPDEKTSQPKGKEKATSQDPPKGKAKATPKPAPPSDESSESSDAEGSKANSDDPGQDEELTLQQVRARKAAHARYMRFSRSMKGKSAFSAINRSDC